MLVSPCGGARAKRVLTYDAAWLCCAWGEQIVSQPEVWQKLDMKHNAIVRGERERDHGPSNR